MIEIDKNIPIPLSKKNRYPFNEMEIGDSFFIPCEKDIKTLRRMMSNVSGAGYLFKKRKNKKNFTFTFRTITVDAETGIRCWRIK